MFPAVNPTVNLLQRQVLCKATRPEAYLQNEPLTMDRLYLRGENDAKTRIFNFRLSKISLRWNPPKVTVLTVNLGKITYFTITLCITPKRFKYISKYNSVLKLITRSST